MTKVDAYLDQVVHDIPDNLELFKSRKQDD